MRAGTTPTRNRHRWHPTVAIALSAALAAGVAGATPANGAIRSGQASSPGQANLAAVSCSGHSWCMAVGRHKGRARPWRALAQIWNGSTWRVLANPAGSSLTSVSCSSPRFCMAAGGPTGAQTWNGAAWRELASPPGGVDGVSCASRTLCMVIYNGKVRSWNGTTWHLWRHATDFCSGGPAGQCGLYGVSCGSRVNCVAVGTETVSQEPVQVSVGAAWNGHHWTRTEPPGDGNPAEMDAIACAGPFCMAAGGAYQDIHNGAIAQAGTWNATTQSWTDTSPDLGVICTGFMSCGWAAVLSCASPSNCMAIDASGSLAWNGTTWTAAPFVSAGKGSYLADLSCGGTMCLAVGYQTISGAQRTLAEIWNGSAWQILPTPRAA
jgi:hypothetical protein